MDDNLQRGLMKDYVHQNGDTLVQVYVPANAGGVGVLSNYRVISAQSCGAYNIFQPGWKILFRTILLILKIVHTR